MARLDWTRDGADWPNRDASRFVRAGGIEWHVQVAGSGPDVLMLHGTGAASHSFRDVIPLLTDHARVIVPDLPGHGFTDARSSLNLSLPGMAAALGRLIKTLDAKPVIAVAHSAGGPILARMCVHGLIAPSRLIVTNGAFLPFKGMAAVLFKPIARALIWNPLVPRAFNMGADAASVRKLIAGVGTDLDDRGLNLYKRLFRNPAHVSGALNMMARWDLDPVVADLSRLTVPVTLIAADRDRAVPPADQDTVAAMIPDAEVRHVSGGHLWHEEQPAAFATMIREALA